MRNLIDTYENEIKDYINSNLNNYETICNCYNMAKGILSVIFGEGLHNCCYLENKIMVFSVRSETYYIHLDNVNFLWTLLEKVGIGNDALVDIIYNAYASCLAKMIPVDPPETDN